MQNASFPLVKGIDPVDGWVLIYDDGDTPDRQSMWSGREYAAVRGDERKPLGVSPRHFNPTNERFAWLVRNGFPGMLVRASGIRTPLCDDDIDAMIPNREAA